MSSWPERPSGVSEGTWGKISNDIIRKKKYAGLYHKPTEFGL